jgi:putative heme-binding domain-containing protein
MEVPADLRGVDWTRLAQQGNAVSGQRLFGRDGLGCVKCHAIVHGQSGNGAPSLIGAADRFTPAYLAESILYPSKVVNPAYKSSLVERTNGTVIVGLIVQQDATSITLLLPDANRLQIPRADIEAVRSDEKSPMPSGLVKSRQELADLLAYLLLKNPPAS